MTATTADIQEWLGYDPKSGAFWWRRTRSNRVAGSEAGHIQCFDNRAYYRMIRFMGSLYFAHTIAWVIMTGEFPKGMLDHKDGDSLNDTWDNFRPCTRSQNQQNRGRPKNNRSGFKGVSWDKLNNRWVVRIRQPGGKYLNLGRFDDKEAAKAVYDETARKLFGEFARPA